MKEPRKFAVLCTCEQEMCFCNETVMMTAAEAVEAQNARGIAIGDMWTCPDCAEGRWVRDPGGDHV